MHVWLRVLCSLSLLLSSTPCDLLYWLKINDHSRYSLPNHSSTSRLWSPNPKMNISGTTAEVEADKNCQASFDRLDFKTAGEICSSVSTHDKRWQTDSASSERTAVFALFALHLQLWHRPPSLLSRPPGFESKCIWCHWLSSQEEYRSRKTRQTGLFPWGCAANFSSWSWDPNERWVIRSHVITTLKAASF